jgi:gliding motility-associated-like protein
VVNAGRDTAICLGQTTVLGGSPTASGGTGHGYTYSWTPTIGISSATSANPVFTGTATTTYTVVVSDSNGCTSSDDITITVRPVPTADAGADKSITICAHDSTFIGNIPAATGGTAPYTYLWSPATGLSSTTVTNPVVSGLTQTTPYHLVVTDTFGCTASDNVIVNVTQQTLQANAGNVNVICASANTPVTIGGNPSVTGGTGPYVYSWSPAAGLSSTSVSNPIATVSATTTYYLTVTDSKGCISVDSVKITQNPAPIVNAGTDTALCLGFGKALGGSPTATGGTGSYQYSWTPTVGLNANNTSNPSAFPQTTTTYQVVVTDSNGCQASDAVTVVINQNPTADAGADVTISTCVGDTAQLGGTPSASGGNGSYTYTWSPTGGLSSTSASNPFVTGIASSSLYGLTVTDGNGCSAADAVLVNVVRSNLSANAGNDANICAGANTIVTLGGNPTPTGGTAPYSYNWSPAGSLNSTVVSNPFATPSVTTGYNVTVTDAKGCTATDSVTVFVNAAPVVNAGRDTIVCAGSPVIVGGSPTVTGTSPFSYSWSPSIGVGNVTASNPVITAAATTTYTVVVVDGNGCSASDQVAITVHQNPTADAGPDKSLVACNADSVMIGGSPAASGGLSPYSYTWSPAVGVSSATSPSPFVSHLGSSSTFTLIVTDQYGCSASDQVLVNVTNSTLFAEAGNNVSICQGASGLVLLGGTPTATGGTPSYIYSWSPATGLGSTTSANPAALPTSTTLYTLVVRDGAGCIATDTVLFTVNPKPVINAGANDTICQGTCVTLGGAPTADGFQGPYTYTWRPSANLNDPSLANPTACPTATTTYTVSVTNQYGCSNTGSVTIRVNPKPTANAGFDQNIVSCPNACITIGGSPTATGGTAPYVYAWSPGLGLDSVTVANPIMCNPKVPLTYTVTVTDANGCSATDNMAVTPVPSDLTADAGIDKLICTGQRSCITIGGSPSVIGGTAPFIVSWSPVVSFCGSSTIQNPQVNPTSSTIYTLFVTDAKGCTSRDTMEVYANPVVTAVVRPDTSVCYGSPAILGGYPTTGSGGTAPYTYAWSPTLGINNSTSGNPIVSTLVTTSYCVTVTDSVGCSTSACQAVNVSSPLVADAGTDKTITGCPGATVTLGGSPVVRGGSGNFSYSWTPTTGLDSPLIAHPHVQNLSGTTTYTLVVTDRVNGCSASDQVVVTYSSSTLRVDAGPDQFLCYDNHTGVQIGGIPTATGGQTPFTYLWSPTAGLSDTSTANPIAKPTTSTTYVLSVTDAVGCAFSDTVRVTVVQRTPVSISGLSPKYCLNANNVTLTGIPAGGTFSGPGVVGNIFRPSQIGVGRWCITYAYTDGTSGCVSDTTICVVVDSLATLSVTGYNPSYCHLDAPVTLVGSPAGGTFSGAGVSGNVFNPANANAGDNVITYSYTDTVLGCSNTLQFTINVKDVPTLSIASSDSLACPGSNVSLSAQYSTDVFNIVWSDLNGNQINSGLNAFTVNPSLANHCYIATAVNTVGCTTKDTLCIQLLDCYIHAVAEPCDADTLYENGSLIVHVLNNDTLPMTGNDTIVTIKDAPLSGTAVVNADHTITYTPEHDFSGNVEMTYQVCVVVRGFSVCDSANVCLTVVDTNIHCHFPNTITPNNDGANDAFEISCNSEYPNGEIRIYDRWGAEVFRSMGHYNNDWKGINQQGTTLPDGTYFYMYFFKDGTNKMKKGFVDVYR